MTNTPDVYEQIPVEVLERYEGQWIVWDQTDKQVVGNGKTLDEAEKRAEHTPAHHLLRLHHVIPRDEDIVGMI